MADLTTDLDDVKEEMAEQDWFDDFIVAWSHEGDGVVCLKPMPVLTDSELVDVEDMVLFMAEYGFYMGYAPGGNAADPQYQFKRME